MKETKMPDPIPGGRTANPEAFEWTEAKRILLLRLWNDKKWTIDQIRQHPKFNCSRNLIGGTIGRLRERGWEFERRGGLPNASKQPRLRAFGMPFVHPEPGTPVSEIVPFAAALREDKSPPLAAGHPITWGSLWLGTSMQEAPPYGGV